MEYLFWGVFVLIILLGIILLIFVSIKKKPKFSKAKIDFYKKEIKKSNYSLPQEKIIQYDKILNHILTDLGYTGNLGDQLKANPPELKNINEIWRLHKIRNKIAHELTSIANSVLLKEANNFEKELNKLLN